MFDVGDSVVCVEDEGQGNPPYVIKGRQYTVSGFNHYDSAAMGAQLVFVAELPALEGIGWYALRFRKIEKKQIKVSTKVEEKA